MLIDSEFAERIINKYTVLGTYRLDEASLVFLKEERKVQPVFAPARKLLLQLFMNWQNYRQSGQKLSVNWNMLERIIAGNLKEEIRLQSGKALKTEAERILKSSLQKEMQQYIKNSTQKETVRYLQNRIQKETEQYLQNILREKTEYGFFSDQQTLQIVLGKQVSRNLKENIRTAAFEGLKKPESSKSAKNTIIKTERQRKKQSHKKKEFEKRLGKSREKQTYGKALAGITERITHTLQHRMQKETLRIRGGIAQNEKERNLNRKRISEPLINQLGTVQKELLLKKRGESENKILRNKNKLIEQELLQNQRILTKKEISQNQSKLTEHEIIRNSRGVLGNQERRLLTQIVQTEIVLQQNIVNIGNFDAYQIFLQKGVTQSIHSQNNEIVRSITGFENIISEEMSSKKAWNLNHFKSDYNAQNQNKYHVRLINSISLLNMLNCSKFLKEIKLAQGPFTAPILRRKMKNSGPFGYIATIFKNRGQNPDEAKKAEKKLVEILIKDFYIQSLKLREQEEKENRIFIARQAVMELLKETESRTAIRTVLLKSDSKQQEMIYHVRLFMGDYAAGLLEKYFYSRNQVTGQALTHQMGLLKKDTEKEMAFSYFSILQKEQILQNVRPDGYIQMENMIREKVHIPAAQNVEAQRIRLQHFVWMLSKDYGIAVQRKRLADHIRQMIRYQAAEDMLLPTIIPKLLTERKPMGIFKNVELLSVKVRKQNQFSENLHSENHVFSQYEKMIYRDSERTKEKWKNQEIVNNQFTAIQYDSQKQILKKQSRQDEELQQTKRLLGTINERVEIQATVLKELKKTSVEGEKLPAENVNQIAKEVLKKMEQELRLEKLRRGLC